MSSEAKKIVGVTLSSPEYAEMSLDASLSFQQRTGLPCITVSTGPGNYLVKLQLAELIRDRTLVFFDSDTLWIKDCDLSEYADREEFFGVADCENHDLNLHNFKECFSYIDCEKLSLDKHKFFNAGMMIFNHRHVPMFRHAAENFGKLGELADYGDQIYINWACQDLGIPIELIDVKFNTVISGYRGKRLNKICPDPVMIHAAGLEMARKQEALQQAVQHYSVRG